MTRDIEKNRLHFLCLHSIIYISNVKNERTPTMHSANTAYDTIFFDADDTLLDFRRAERGALTDALTRFGIEATEEIISRYSEINLGFWKLLELGKTTKPVLKLERFRVLCEEFSFSADYLELANAYMERLATKAYLIEGAEDICKTLSKRCKLYVVTNGAKDIQQSRFGASGLEKYFSGVFISDDIGYEKPDIRFFEHVERTLGVVDRKKALLVGDSLSSDMKGAKNFGVDSCYFDPRGKGYPEDLGIKYSISKLSELEKIVLPNA